MAKVMQFTKDEMTLIRQVFSKILEIDDEEWWDTLDNRVLLGLGLRFDVPEVINELMSENERSGTND